MGFTLTTNAGDKLVMDLCRRQLLGTLFTIEGGNSDLSALTCNLQLPKVLILPVYGLLLLLRGSLLQGCRPVGVQVILRLSRCLLPTLGPAVLDLLFSCFKPPRTPKP